MSITTHNQNNMENIMTAPAHALEALIRPLEHLRTKEIVTLIENATGKIFVPKDKKTAIALYNKYCPFTPPLIEQAAPALAPIEASPAPIEETSPEPTPTPATTNERKGAFDAKMMAIKYDPTNDKQRKIVDSYPKQARMILSIWLEAKMPVVTGQNLVGLCEQQPEFLGRRSAKLVIQRYVTYLVRDGLMEMV